MGLTRQLVSRAMKKIGFTSSVCVDKGLSPGAWRYESFVHEVVFQRMRDIRPMWIDSEIGSATLEKVIEGIIDRYDRPHGSGKICHTWEMDAVAASIHIFNDMNISLSSREYVIYAYRSQTEEIPRFVERTLAKVETAKSRRNAQRVEEIIREWANRNPITLS